MSKIKVAIFILVGVPLLAIISIIILCLIDSFPTPPAHQFYLWEVRDVSYIYKEHSLAIKSKKSDRPLRILTGRADIDWYELAKKDKSASPGPPICQTKNTECMAITGGIIAYNTKQKFDRSNKNNFINFTVIPDAESDAPASILLFADGRIRSGESYIIGNQCKNGLAIIKPDPNYVKN